MQYPIVKLKKEQLIEGKASYSDMLQNVALK